MSRVWYALGAAAGLLVAYWVVFFGGEAALPALLVGSILLAGLG